MVGYDIWIGIMASLMAVCAVFITITPIFFDNKFKDMYNEFDKRFKQQEKKLEEYIKESEAGMSFANNGSKMNEKFQKEVDNAPKTNIK